MAKKGLKSAIFSNHKDAKMNTSAKAKNAKKISTTNSTVSEKIVELKGSTNGKKMNTSAKAKNAKKISTTNSTVSEKIVELKGSTNGKTVLNGVDSVNNEKCLHAADSIMTNIGIGNEKKGMKRILPDSAGSEKKRMKRTLSGSEKKSRKRNLSDSDRFVKNIENGKSNSKKTCFDNRNKMGSSEGPLHSKKRHLKSENNVIEHKGSERICEGMDKVTKSSPESDKRAGEGTKSDSFCDDENSVLKVGPSQGKNLSLLRRSRGKRRRKSSTNNNNSSYSTQTSEKSQTYQRINKECYVAVDCEMVGVGAGGIRSALGRCSIVDYDGEVLYDKYIRGQEPVTDFRTAYSGITPEHMKTAETLSTAKQQIHSLLKNKVIVAHSINNDLKVMQFYPHRYLVRDTVKCHMLCGIARQNGYQGEDNALIPLRVLAKSILGIDIQVGDKGHDSVEDARATMELFRRVRNGWEKMLFAKWSNRESFNVAYVVNGLNNQEDVCDADGVRITDYRCDDVGGEVDYLGDEFWPSV